MGNEIKTEDVWPLDVSKAITVCDHHVIYTEKH